MTKFSIMIGTPCYGGMLHQDYVKSLLEYSSLNIGITCAHIGNESLITRGRNTIISGYYANKDKFTHLLFLDADIYLSAQDLTKLLMADTDIICAAVPLKGFTKEGNPIYNITKIINDHVSPNIIEVEHVGTAVMLLSTNVVEELCESSDKYKGSTITRGEQLSELHYDVFKTGVFDEMYLSEDYYICKKLRDMGYKILVDASIHTRHSGSFTWQG